MIIVGYPFTATGHYGTSCVGEPDSVTRENGCKLGQRGAGLVKQFASRPHENWEGV